MVVENKNFFIFIFISLNGGGDEILGESLSEGSRRSRERLILFLTSGLNRAYNQTFRLLHSSFQTYGHAIIYLDAVQQSACIF